MSKDQSQKKRNEDLSMKKITKRMDDYSQWYSDIIVAADLAEHSPVRGCMVIKPYGYAIWEKIQEVLNKMLKEKGVENAYFPLFIPEEFIKRETEHIDGFSPELAIVTHAGGKKLTESLVVRPTSETIIYDSFSNWIQSYRDLPLLINQWANVVRWEKRPRLFLRTTEFLWQEGHTAHAESEEAKDYALMILKDVYKRFVEEYLAMPVYTGKKSQKEKFAGALNTYCIEALMQDGKSLQAGTSHDLSDHFAQSFDVKYSDQNGDLKFVYQSSWGVSTRLIGGLIMMHSDDKGLVLPPNIAPYQFVIVPIQFEKDERVLVKVQEIKKILEELYSVKLDDRNNMRPGEKFYEWEKKGVPVRIELGPRDLENNTCVMVRRDNGEKINVNLNDLLKKGVSILDNIQTSLFKNAFERRNDSNKIVDTWDGFEQGINAGGYLFAHWCEKTECELAIKEKTKAVSRCLSLDAELEEGEHHCIHCGKISSGKRWIFAKAY